MTERADRPQPGPQHAATAHMATIAALNPFLPASPLAGAGLVALVVAGALGFGAVPTDASAAPAGVNVAGIPVEGMDRAAITALVEDKAAATRLHFNVDGTTRTASLAQLGIDVDADATAEEALLVATSPVMRAVVRLQPRDVPVVATIDTATLGAFAMSLTDAAGHRASDARVSLGEDGATFVVTEAVDGWGVSLEALLPLVEAAAHSLEEARISPRLEPLAADVTTEEATQVATQANLMVSTPVTLGIDGTEVSPDQAQRTSWVGISTIDGTPMPVLSKDRIASWVDAVASEVEKAPVAGINNVDASGNLLEPARPPKDGAAVTDREGAVQEIVSALSSGEEARASVQVVTLDAGIDERVVPSGPERFAYRPGAGEKWVDVNLTYSTLTAYEGYTQVHGPIFINHGGVGHETVTGVYKVYIKLPVQNMGCTPEWPYCEENVPWIAYWHQSYALHGAPWVKEFGVGTDETSHGCVNIPVPDAKWLYDWVELGTTVVPHY